MRVHFPPIFYVTTGERRKGLTTSSSSNVRGRRSLSPPLQMQAATVASVVTADSSRCVIFVFYTLKRYDTCNILQKFCSAIILFLSFHLPINLSTYLCTYLSIYSSIYLPTYRYTYIYTYITYISAMLIRFFYIFLFNSSHIFLCSYFFSSNIYSTLSTVLFLEDVLLPIS